MAGRADARGRAGHRQDGDGARSRWLRPRCRLPDVGSEVFVGGEEDGGADGELPAAIGLRIKERKEVYEGEVTEPRPRSRGPARRLRQDGGARDHRPQDDQGDEAAEARPLDPSLEKVTPGDVIYIERTRAPSSVGRSDAFATEFDLEAEEYAARIRAAHLAGAPQFARNWPCNSRARASRRAPPPPPLRYVPLPKGDVHKKKEGAGRDASRPRPSEREAAGRPGLSVDDGLDDEAAEDRDHREAAHRDQQGRQQVHRPGHRRARPRRPLY